MTSAGAMDGATGTIPLHAAMKTCLDIKDNATIYNLTLWVACDNNSSNGGLDGHLLNDDGSTDVEHIVSIVVAICFGLIGLAGLFGNSLVILGECVDA